MFEDLGAPPSPPTPVGPLSTVPAERPPAPPQPRRRRWLAWLAATLGLLVLVALAAAAFIHVPYVIISPGNATPLDDQVLQVEGAQTYPHAGELLYLTVAVSNRDPNLYRYLFARLDGDVEVDRRQEVNGCASYDEVSRLARDQMEQSQDVAKTVALRRLGYEVPDLASRVLVLDVMCGGPSEGRLELGDVVVAVDGAPVTSADQVKPLVVAHRPRDTVVFTVERDGVRHDVPIRLRKTPKLLPDGRPSPEPGVAFAGIVTQTDRRHEVPLAVNIDTARVSGPSAGLAFTLAIIDDLTPGDLTGGGDVAVTGTIREDGSVGEVGGIAQKTVTARQAGARMMLVPAEEVGDARAKAGDMKVVGVRTLEDTLRALATSGGGSVPSMAVPAASAQ